MEATTGYVPTTQLSIAYGEDRYYNQDAVAAMKLLIIEDEPAIQEMVSSRMQREGYDTLVAATAEEGMRIFRRTRPGLILLDLMLPYMSGIEFCKALRRESMTPVIIISAKAEEGSRVQALEAGADDYLVKPFSLSELSARVKAVLRRTSTLRTEEPVSIGPLKIDPRRHEVRLNGTMIDLSPKEFSLLHFLASHPGQVFSRTALLDRVWGKDAFVSERTVDVHIRWIRSKIEKDDADPSLILTVRGVGYKFVG
jgi:two-component system, OmpR family, phosphate regulon response regulator PhoB